MEFYEALFIVVLTLLFILGLAHVLYRLFSNWAPGKKRLEKDVARMRAEAKNWIQRLVPWDNTEMELFSLNHEILSSSKSFGKSLEGVFKTIYHEPMLYFVYREYIARKRNAILLIRTSKHEFLYRFRKGRIGVYFNDEPLGWFDKDKDILFGPDQEQKLARIKMSETAQLPVFVGEQEVAHLANPDRAEKVNPRAFSLLDKNLNENQASILLGLSAFQLIERQLDKRFRG